MTKIFELATIPANTTL